MDSTKYKASEEFVKNIGDTELQHWKYIKKIPSGKGFRYFYSWDEWRGHLDKAKQNGQNSTVKKYISVWREKIERAINSAKKYQSTSFKEVLQRNSKANEKTKTRVKQLITNKGSKNTLVNGGHKYKYIAKETINGKVRYFYTQDDLDAYMRRKNYQNNEPDFMKSVKESKDYYTAEEDSVLVNPNYDPFDSDENYEYNCAECTAIYELRRRGYDVESNGVSGAVYTDDPEEKLELALTYNTDRRFDTMYKNAKIERPKATDDPDDTYRELMKIFDKHPPNSRGDISVAWSSGGGHSMAWEKDSNGEVHIIDTQCSYVSKSMGPVRTEVDLRDLCSEIDNSPGNTDGVDKEYGVLYKNITKKQPVTEITRTDNLELKPGILKICKESSLRSVNDARGLYSSENNYENHKEEYIEKYPNLYVANGKQNGKRTSN